MTAKTLKTDMMVSKLKNKIKTFYCFFFFVRDTVHNWDT